jgi:hypothetical protein
VDVTLISIPRLALAFIPVAIVIVLMWRWSHGYGRALYSVGRMLLQLTLIGYVLIYIFQAESGLLIAGVLGVMLVAASWIALNTRRRLDAGPDYARCPRARPLVSTKLHDPVGRHDFLGQHDQYQPRPGAPGCRNE